MTISATPGEGLVERLTALHERLAHVRNAGDMLLVREAIAALSRATEPIGYITSYGGVRWLNPPIPIGTTLYATPPAQPALALIEELERALLIGACSCEVCDRAEEDRDDSCRRQTAIASAKRFRTGE